MPALEAQVRLAFMPTIPATHEPIILPPQILREKGADALLDRLIQQREASLPQYKQSRPKYAAYFTWMSRRIAERFPELDECARDKLLCMDSGELDLLLAPDSGIDAAMALEAARQGLDWEAFQASAAGHVLRPTLMS